jgi:hypothetical protein
MPFAIKNDNSGFRCVNADTPLEADETLHDSLPAAYLLAQAQLAKAAALATACDASLLDGFHSSALGEPHHYPSLPDDKTNLVGTLLLASATGQSQPFRCTRVSDGVKTAYTHSAAQLAGVMTDGQAVVLAAYAALDTKLAAVAAASTLAEVAAVTWEA